MRWKEAFIFTLREEPAEAELISHKLMLRSSMIQKLASGIYNYLPLGLRVIRKIENIIREEMNRCGAAELLMPMVIPSELWLESGRWNYYGPELLRFNDRKNMAFCLGPTHEEVVVDIARRVIRSYRDLPVCLYQIQTKFRDEIRPRYGLMRGREFIMKDAYSFHADEESLDQMYWKMHEVYTNIFTRCGLKFRSVEADSGTIGGSVTHEFHVLASSGEDTLAYCDSCNYAANIEKASSICTNTIMPLPKEAPMPLEVATPSQRSVEEVAAFLKTSSSTIIKTLLYDVNGGEYTVAVCTRGDKAVNETKLRALLKADSVSPPDEAEVEKRLNVSVGYLGPNESLRKKIKEIIADFSVQSMGECVIGANRKGYHLVHVYPSRDLSIDRYADLGFVQDGQPCPKCEKGNLLLRKGIEVGQIFKLGEKYSNAMKMNFLNENGIQQTVIMGCYGIGVGRTAAASIEQNHDADGIIWPVSIAPYTVALLTLDHSDQQIVSKAERIYNELLSKGIDVLFDDRDERPGVKFKDADLIGCPIRINVGKRGLNDGTVEIKLRKETSVEKVACEDVLNYILRKLETS